MSLILAVLVWLSAHLHPIVIHESGRGSSSGVLSFAPLLGAVVAAITLPGLVRGTWRQTVGRRRQRYGRLQRLGTGARLDFFESVMGEPPVITNILEVDPEHMADEEQMVWGSPQEHREHIFLDRFFWLQVVTDPLDTVVGYSVTARSRWFRPTFTMPPRMSAADRLRGRVAKRLPIPESWRYRLGFYEPFFRVKLNRTRFSDARQSWAAPEENEDWVRARRTIGARSWSYSEIHSFGNPGYYQTFVLTTSHIAASRKARIELLHGLEVSDTFDAGEITMTDAGKQFRKSSVVTSYTVLSGTTQPDVWARRLNFGPHGDEVRILP